MTSSNSFSNFSNIGSPSGSENEINNVKQNKKILSRVHAGISKKNSTKGKEILNEKIRLNSGRLSQNEKAEIIRYNSDQKSFNFIAKKINRSEKAVMEFLQKYFQK